MVEGQYGSRIAPFRLDSTSACVYCECLQAVKPLSRDHYFPQALLGRGKVRERPGYKAAHPLSLVIEDHANLIVCCLEDHRMIDDQKIAAYLPKKGNFTSPFRGNPDHLMVFLREGYRLTDSPVFRRKQVRCIKRVTSEYITAVNSLTIENLLGILPYYDGLKDVPVFDQAYNQAECLLKKYKDSLKIAYDHIEYLEDLTYWVVSYPGRPIRRDYIN